MMKTKISLVLTLCVVIGFSPLFAVDISGNYNAAGTNPNGTSYKGTVKITKKKDVYFFQWKVGKSYKGSGKLSNDLLIVNWGDKYPVIYSVQSDGILNGTWADGKATEVLTPQ